MCDFLGIGEDGLDQSLVSDYEAKLSLKKEEVSQLLQEREELRATHNRLLSLKKKMHFRQVCVHGQGRGRQVCVCMGRVEGDRCVHMGRVQC